MNRYFERNDTATDEVPLQPALLKSRRPGAVSAQDPTVEALATSRVPRPPPFYTLRTQFGALPAVCEDLPAVWSSSGSLCGSDSSLWSSSGSLWSSSGSVWSSSSCL